MRKLIIKGTDIESSRVGLGLSGLHRLYSRRERQKLLAFAFDVGITHFDTAPLYGHGIAEKELSYFLRDLCADVTIASKVGIPSNVWYRKAPYLMYAQKLSRRVTDFCAVRRKKECWCGFLS